MSANPAEVVAGLLLLFFLPGYVLTKAVFPDWRVRGRVAALRLVELLTLSLVSSVALTVVVGYVLLVAGPSGFQAAWSDPALEALLAGVSVAGFGVGWLRGAYARVPPPAFRPEPESEPDPWETVRALDRLRREERRLRHALRGARPDSADAVRLEAELERVTREARDVSGGKEAEYAN